MHALTHPVLDDNDDSLTKYKQNAMSTVDDDISHIISDLAYEKLREETDESGRANIKVNIESEAHTAILDGCSSGLSITGHVTFYRYLVCHSF